MASSASSQIPDLTTPVNYARTVQDLVKDLVTRAAEKMPAEHYAFTPAPGVRSFAEILGHIADTQYYFSCPALGEKNPSLNVEKTKHTKAELTEALAKAFAYSDRAYGVLTDANAADVLQWPDGPGRARLGALSFNATHAYGHYGNLATYMRIKSIVPPSSEPRA